MPKFIIRMIPNNTFSNILEMSETAKKIERISHKDPRSTPPELMRYMGLSYWGPAYTLFKSYHGFFVSEPKWNHIDETLRLSSYFEKEYPELFKDEWYIINGLIVVHDLDTTSPVRHITRSLSETPQYGWKTLDVEVLVPEKLQTPIKRSEKQILLDELRGQGPFENSNLPEFLADLFGDPTVLANEIEKDSPKYRFVDAMEDIEHTLHSSLRVLSSESLKDVIENLRPNAEVGKIEIHKDFYVKYSWPKEYMRQSKSGVSYNRQDLFCYFMMREYSRFSDVDRSRAITYEAYLLDMVEKVLNMRDENWTMIFTYTDDDWYQLLRPAFDNENVKKLLDIWHAKKLPESDPLPRFYGKIQTSPMNIFRFRELVDFKCGHFKVGFQNQGPEEYKAFRTSIFSRMAEIYRGEPTTISESGSWDVVLEREKCSDSKRKDPLHAIHMFAEYVPISEEDLSFIIKIGKEHWGHTYLTIVKEDIDDEYREIFAKVGVILKSIKDESPFKRLFSRAYRGKYISRKSERNKK